MDKLLNICLALGVIGLTLGATWLMDGHDGAPAPEISSYQSAPVLLHTLAPDATLTGLNGVDVKLYDFSGKVILLNFWASWCAPCIVEFQQFINLAKMMPDDIVILAVSIDDDRSDIDKFIKTRIPDYNTVSNLHIFHDRDKSVSLDLFQTAKVPETIIITPKMMMARKIAGLSIEWDNEDTKRYLSGLKDN